MLLRKSPSPSTPGVTVLWLLAALVAAWSPGVAAEPDAPAGMGGLVDGPYAFYSEDRSRIHLYWLCDDDLIERAQPLERPIPVECGYPRPITARPPADVHPEVHFEASRIAALSDIHGQFDVLTDLLRNNEIINDALEWTFGDGHLVIVGDVFDRGDRQTEVLWLLYQLEQQAAEQGGRVHTLLGNHETMVLYDDLRYLHSKYTAVADSLARPFSDLYGKDTVLGAWLHARPVIITINDILFVHAGLHPDYLELGLSVGEVNEHYRQSLGLPRSIVMETPVLEFLYGRLGPLWYRGFFRDDDSLSGQALDDVANALGVERIVVGHTSFPGVHKHWGGRVINVDSNIKRGERGEVLFWEEGTFNVGSQSGERSRVPHWNE